MKTTSYDKMIITSALYQTRTLSFILNTDESRYLEVHEAVAKFRTLRNST